MKTLTITLSVLLLATCLTAGKATTASAEEKPAILDVKLLVDGWSHSREEDEKGVRVFRRTASKKWPPSRFRMKYKFNVDGTGSYLYLHPTDRHMMMPMRWKIDPVNPREIVITAKHQGKVDKTILKVVELTATALKVK